MCIPRGGGGITVTAEAVRGSQPAGGHDAANTHATTDSGRAALGAINPAHPSRQSSCPTRWNAGQVLRPGCGADNATARSRSTVLRSANSRRRRHSWWSYGMWSCGERLHSASERYHSAVAVSTVSARYSPGTTSPRCQRPSAGLLARPSRLAPCGTCLTHVPSTVCPSTGRAHRQETPGYSISAISFATRR